MPDTLGTTANTVAGTNATCMMHLDDGTSSSAAPKYEISMGPAHSANAVVGLMQVEYNGGAAVVQGAPSGIGGMNLYAATIPSGVFIEEYSFDSTTIASNAGFLIDGSIHPLDTVQVAQTPAGLVDSPMVNWLIGFQEMQTNGSAFPCLIRRIRVEHHP